MSLHGNQFFAVGVGLSCAPSKVGCEGPVDVGIDQPDLLAGPRKRDRQVRRNGRLSDAALAAADRDERARGLRGGQRNARLVTPGVRERGVAQVSPAFAALRRSSPVASAMIVAMPPTTLRERIRSSCGRSVSGSTGWAMGAT